MLFDLFGQRRSLENPTVSLASGPDFKTFYNQSANIRVDEETALGVPAIWNAVNIIAGTIGHLPLHLYKLTDGQPDKAISNPLYSVVHDYANDYHTKFDFWKLMVFRALVSGRAIALLLRDNAKRVAGFLPVDEAKVTITQTVANGVVSRTYTILGKAHDGADVIDIAPVLKADGITAISPIASNTAAIGAMIAAEQYASAMFANGGVPPLVLTGPALSPGAADRAEEQIAAAMVAGKDRKRQMFAIPSGFELKPVGIEPAKQQLVELRKWQTSEASRIFNIAPALLHDLTTGTYSNVEQQSLNFAQQTILPLVKQIEQQLNLKLFGKRNTKNYAEFNMDALVRGDLLSRMEALARSVNAGLRTPNEARALDNLPALPGGDKLYVQGAMVPIEEAGAVRTPTVPTDTTDA